jgi:16S rRNA (adenine1518-N6/adenine1519-N6)-dimethyltransferase
VLDLLEAGLGGTGNTAGTARRRGSREAGGFERASALTGTNQSLRRKGRQARAHRREEPAPERARAALSRAGIRPSKARGQNFLVQPRVADRIVDALEVGRADEVVEIGPGLGILSERIAARGPRRLVLVEVEPGLAARLRERFRECETISVINADFFELDFGGLLGGGQVKVAGNLPFSAAGAIFRRLCEHANRIARMVLMFQREVGARIRAHPGARDYAALSVYASLYWTITAHFMVGAGNFEPRPKVDAEVLTFVARAQTLFAPEDEQRVLETVRAAFSARRKTLRNALAQALEADATEIERALARAGVDPRERAERLSAAEFVRLARELGPMLNPAAEADRRDA